MTSQPKENFKSRLGGTLGIIPPLLTVLSICGTPTWLSMVGNIVDLLGSTIEVSGILESSLALVLK